MILDMVWSLLVGPVRYLKTFVKSLVTWLVSLALELPSIPVRDGCQPPGPICNWLPIFGSLPLFSIETSHLVLVKMAEKYGRIFRLKLGETNFVVIADHELLQQTFSKAIAVGRNMPTMMDVMNHQGIVHADGNFWKTQRAFASSTLRRLGMPPSASNSAFEEKASTAIDDFLQELEATNGQPTAIDEGLCFTLTNIFFSLIVGKTFLRDDHQLLAIINATHDSFRSIDPISFPNYVPRFSILPKQQKLLQDMGQRRTVFTNYMATIVEEHIQNEGQEGNVPDLIDAFVLRMRKDLGNPRTSFTNEQLYYILGDLFSASLETVAATIHWILLAILTNPQILENIHSEMDKVIYSKRPLALSDRDSLPYLHATILEGLRFPSLLPIGVFHNTVIHSTIEGYDVPVNSTVVGLLWKIHRDPKLWANPNSFDPMNHINARGILEKSRFLMPFSYGRRACIGDNVAQNELFLILANILNKFKILPEEGVDLPSLHDSLEGVLRAPYPFKIRVIPRSDKR